MFRKDFVQRKLQLIAEDLGHLLHFRDLSLQELTDDFVQAAAVERILERMVMRAIDVNEHLISELSTGAEERITRLSYRDTFLWLAELGVYPRDFAERIAKSAGLRNILVHDYNDLNREVVHSSIQSCLEDYHLYVEFLQAFVRQGGDGQ
ncbi:MAG: DUF86 domain-containing protein [Desulfohalobiaceae bacterium]